MLGNISNNIILSNNTTCLARIFSFYYKMKYVNFLMFVRCGPFCLPHLVILWNAEV